MAQRRGRGHGQARGRQAPLAPFGGQLQQLAGVVAGQDARGDHRVVGGQLGLAAQGAGGGPHQGIGPVEGAGDQGHGLGQAVGAAHMGQLVAQHRLQPRRRPIDRLVGQEDHGAQHAPGHGAWAVLGHQQLAAAHGQGQGPLPGRRLAAHHLQAHEHDQVLHGQLGQTREPGGEGQGDQDGPQRPARAGAGIGGRGRRRFDRLQHGRGRRQVDHRQARRDQRQERQGQEHGEGHHPGQAPRRGPAAIGLGQAPGQDGQGGRGDRALGNQQESLERAHRPSFRALSISCARRSSSSGAMSSSLSRAATSRSAELSKKVFLRVWMALLPASSRAAMGS